MNSYSLFIGPDHNLPRADQLQPKHQTPQDLSELQTQRRHNLRAQSLHRHNPQEVRQALRIRHTAKPSQATTTTTVHRRHPEPPQ